MQYPNIVNPGETWERVNISVDSGGNLYVVDTGNNRILRYNEPFSTDKSDCKGDTLPDFVWGQDDFISGGVNHGLGKDLADDHSLFLRNGESGSAASPAYGVSADATGGVWVADPGNGRVLHFPKDTKNADIVLGKSSFTDNLMNWGGRDNTGQLVSACRGSDDPMDNLPLDKLCNPILARVHPVTGELYVLDSLIGHGYETRIHIFSPPFVNGMSARKIFKPVTGPGNEGQGYYFRGLGFDFNYSCTEKYAKGALWVSELVANRVTLVNEDGNIFGLVGAKDENSGGCDFSMYGSCHLKNPGEATTFSVCHVGPIGIDNAGNFYVPDSQQHRLAIYKAPYTTYTLQDGTVCVPEPVGGLFAGNSPNKLDAGKTWAYGAGTNVTGNQLIVVDSSRILGFNDYLNKGTYPNADVVAGQADHATRSSETFWQVSVGTNWQTSVDGGKRLWTFRSGKGTISVFQLPLTDSTQPISQNVVLYWNDWPNEQVDLGEFGMFAYDGNGKLWLSDTGHHRILRIKNPEAIQTGDKLYVDRALGQTARTEVRCNRGNSTHPTDYTLCNPRQLLFDRIGNLWVSEAMPECASPNHRIIMYSKTDLDSMSTSFPNFPARKVIGAPDFNTIGGWELNAPGCPVTLTFGPDNRLFVATDGYYSVPAVRHLRNIWFWNDPLLKDSHGAYVQNQRADGYVNLPTGSVAEMFFDSIGNSLIRDGVWNRLWMLKLTTDSSWLVNNPTPD